jgi:hypothetical protein
LRVDPGDPIGLRLLVKFNLARNRFKALFAGPVHWREENEQTDLPVGQSPMRRRTVAATSRQRA